MRPGCRVAFWRRAIPCSFARCGGWVGKSYLPASMPPQPHAPFTAHSQLSPPPSDPRLTETVSGRFPPLMPPYSVNGWVLMLSLTVPCCTRDNDTLSLDSTAICFEKPALPLFPVPRCSTVSPLSKGDPLRKSQGPKYKTWGGAFLKCTFKTAL